LFSNLFKQRRDEVLKKGGNMGKEVKRQSVRKLFVERMKREGRGKEWFSTVKQVSKETGQRYGQAAWEAMRRLGYTGPEKERQLHQVFLENEDKTKLQRQIDAEQEQINFTVSFIVA
jgi:hypothetical protein